MAHPRADACVGWASPTIIANRFPLVGDAHPTPDRFFSKNSSSTRFPRSFSRFGCTGIVGAHKRLLTTGPPVSKMLERTDAELVEAARKGDVSSFGELYRRHYAAMVGVAYCAVSDHHLAEDAAQEAFAVACRDLGRLRRVDRFAPWLGAICRKVARRAAKSRFRHPLPEEPIAAADTDANDGRLAIVRQSVRRLPERAREVVLLHYFSGLSYEEIAAALGISPQAVHGRLIRARQKMAEYLRRNGSGT